MSERRLYTIDEVQEIERILSAITSARLQFLSTIGFVSGFAQATDGTAAGITFAKYARQVSVDLEAFSSTLKGVRQQSWLTFDVDTALRVIDLSLDLSQTLTRYSRWYSDDDLVHIRALPDRIFSELQSLEITRA